MVTKLRYLSHMLSVCFIVKNEEKWLGECIEHLKPYVNEFIVVDTGSSDRTKEIAQSKGARVFDFAWTGNFSDARNFALSKATQPWILKVDPDERIDPEHLRHLLTYTQDSKVWAVRTRTRSYTQSITAISEGQFQPCTNEFPERERGFRGFKEIMYTRLFRNRPEIRFSGKVHETIEHSINQLKLNPNPIVSAPGVLVHHYGQDEAEIRAKDKLGTYEKLMAEELVEKSDHGFVSNELGMLLMQKGEFEKAAETFALALKAQPESAELCTNLGYALMRMGRREQGEVFMLKSVKLDPKNPAALVNYAISRMEAKDYEVAKACLERALELNPRSLMTLRAYGQCLAHMGDLSTAEFVLRKSISLFDDFVDAKMDLAIVLQTMGRAVEAKKLCEETLKVQPTDSRAQALMSSLQA